MIYNVNIMLVFYYIFYFKVSRPIQESLNPGLYPFLKMYQIVAHIRWEFIFFHLALVLFLMIGEGLSCRSVVLDRYQAHASLRYMVNDNMIEFIIFYFEFIHGSIRQNDGNILQFI